MRLDDKYIAQTALFIIAQKFSFFNSKCRNIHAFIIIFDKPHLINKSFSMNGSYDVPNEDFLQSSTKRSKKAPPDGIYIPSFLILSLSLSPVIPYKRPEFFYLGVYKFE